MCFRCFCLLLFFLLFPSLLYAQTEILEGLVGVSYSYDDNVSYNPIKVAEGIDNKTTSYFRITFNYPLLSFNFNYYDYAYAKRKEFNTNGYVVGLKFSKNESDANFSLGCDFSSFKKEGRNYYATRYLEARSTFRLLGGNWSSVYFGQLLGDYAQEDYKPLSYKENILGIKYYLIGNLNLTIELIQSLAERDDYSYDAKIAKISHSFDLPSGIECSVSDSYLLKDFLFEDALGGVKRKDQRNTIDFSFSKEFFRGLNLNLRYQFIINRSNLNPDTSVLGYGSYEESIVSIGLSKIF